MRVPITGLLAAGTLSVLAITGCSKPASTAQATAVPSSSAKAVAEITASPWHRAVPVPAKKAAPAPTKKASPAPTRSIIASPVLPANTAKPVNPKTVVAPVRKTSAPAIVIATRPPATAAPAAPVVIAAAGDPAHGKQLYMQNCSSCHGATGQGGLGPSLQNEASRKNLDQAMAWIKNPVSPMPKLYRETVSNKDVLDVATYVESLK